jgi:cystathionine beta-lyase
MTNPLTELDDAQLRLRSSAKWRVYDPDVLPMWVAEMDTPLAPAIVAALTRAVERGDTGYAHPGRLPEAFAGYAYRRFGWAADPGRMVVVPDVLRGLGAVLDAVTAPGDGVVINTPVYPPFFPTINDRGRRVVESPLGRTRSAGYALDLDRLAHDLARPGVAAYLLCNPHNPTGLVLRRDELSTVVELTQRHGVRLLVDEIHAPLTYPGVSFTAMATVEGSDAAISFNSASKAFNLPGLKAALVVACGERASRLIEAVPRELAYGSGIFGVIAATAAFTDGDIWLADLLAGLDHNRRLLARLLGEQLPGVGYTVPDATYLAWLDLSALDLGDDPAEPALRIGRVALSSGLGFGSLGVGHARLNFATSPQRLTEGVRRLAATAAAVRSGEAAIISPEPPSLD